MSDLAGRATRNEGGIGGLRPRVAKRRAADLLRHQKPALDSRGTKRELRGMAKRAAYLPSSVRSVGAMIADSIVVTWHCDKGHSDEVDLARIARQRGDQFSLVDKRSHCRQPGCNALVYFRYSASRGTPSRRLEAIRERENAAIAAHQSIDLALAQLVQLYNNLARLHGRPPLKE